MSTQLNMFSPVAIVGILIGLVILAIGWFWLVRLFASAVEGPLNPSNESMTQVHVDTSSALASVQNTTALSSVLLPMQSEQKADQDKRFLLETPVATSHFVGTTAGTTPVAEDTKAPASNLPASVATVTTALTSPAVAVLATSGTTIAETSKITLFKQRPWQQRQPKPLRRRQPLGKHTIAHLRKE